MINLYLAFTSKKKLWLSIHIYIHIVNILYYITYNILLLYTKFMCANILCIDNHKIHSFMLDTNWIVCIYIVSKSYINKITCVGSIDFNTLYRIHSAPYLFYALQVTLPQSAKQWNLYFRFWIHFYTSQVWRWGVLQSVCPPSNTQKNIGAFYACVHMWGCFISVYTSDSTRNSRNFFVLLATQARD